MLIPKEMPRLLSVVIPLYNEEPAFPYLKAELLRARKTWGCPAEIILVDDGSTDRTYELIHAWALEDASVRTIAMSRNFGHQIAVTAGMDAACGDAVVVMDADLQDPPALISKMLEGYCAGYDVVYGERTDRQEEPVFKIATARLFYGLMKRFIHRELPENVGDFRLISRRVAEDLRNMPERDRFLRGMITWLGYHQTAVPYSRPGRVAGKTKYPLWKMVKLAFTAILSFSDLPLRMIMWMGVASMGLAFALVLRTLVLYFFGDTPLVLGWASLFVAVCFFSGLIMVSLGVLGLYLGKIYTESQGRPLYRVQHTRNIEGRPFR